MADPFQDFYLKKLERCRTALKNNGFEVHVCQSAQEAGRLAAEKILVEAGARRVSWGDSMTMAETGVLQRISQMPGIELLVTFDASVPRQEIIERRRKALWMDLFLTGTNAVTETGALVNLDMIGNRVSGLMFGPTDAVVFVGRNKIVPGLPEALARIKTVAAPANAIRHPTWRTPCRRTGRCTDCASPDRICNTWSIVEKCFPEGRIKVILINQDLGL